jgi:hypothetical protein
MGKSPDAIADAIYKSEDMGATWIQTSDWVD